MRLSLRFIVPLILALAAVAYGVLPLVERLTFQWFVRDLDIRASLIANTVQEPLEDLVVGGNRARLLQFFTRITQDERIFAIGYCRSLEGVPVGTQTIPATISCGAWPATRARRVTSSRAPMANS